MNARNMILASIGCALVLVALAVWGICDVLRGEAGPEDLVLTIPFFVTSISFAAIMVGRLRRFTTSTPAASPLAASDFAEHMWRYAKWSGWSVSLLIIFSMSVWGLRSQSIWAPALVGVLAIAATWIGVTVFFRPKGRAR